MIDGDINSDQQVDIRDAISILKILGGLPVNFTIEKASSISDVRFSLKDIIWILQFISEREL